jgi:hypothetical protein
MPSKFLAPATTEVEEDGASEEKSMGKEPRVVEPAPEICIGEPIEPPPPAGTFLPEAHLVIAGEVAGTRQ